MNEIALLEARISLHEENGHTHILPILYWELRELQRIEKRPIGVERSKKL